MPLDVFGKKVRSYPAGNSAANQLYQLPSDGDGHRLPAPTLAQDMVRILARHRHRLLISDSRYIAETFPLVAGAVQQKADYVCQAGFTPHFTGKKREWGKRARELLIEAHKIISVRGPQFHWNRLWHIGCTMFDVDGDFFIYPGKSSTGYPQIQFLEGHRVGSRYGETEVMRGRYEGLPIFNGVIYNRKGRAVAYRFLGSTPDEDKDISARDVIHCGIPRWFSAGRPVPTLTHSILDWYDIKETRGYQKLKSKVSAALTLVEKTPDGKAPDSVTRAAAVNWEKQRAAAAAASTTTPARPGTATTPLVATIAGGLIRYVKSQGGDIDTHQDNTPSDQNLRFDERLQAGAFYGMGWRFEMLDLAKLTGAATRGFSDQINTSIGKRWLDMVPYVYASELHILSCLMDRGDLEPDPEWWKWAYPAPAKFTVDQGRAAKAELDLIRAGGGNMPDLIERSGMTTEENLRKQAEFLVMKRGIEEEYDLPEDALGSLAYPGWPEHTFPARSEQDRQRQTAQQNEPAKEQ